MKNNFKNIKFLSTIILIFFVFNKLFAEDVIINADQVDIKDKGNLIIASGSVNIKDGKKIDIKGEKVTYDKNKQIVEIEGNVLFNDKANHYNASSDKILFNRKENVIFSYGNTEFVFFDSEKLNETLKVNGKNSFFDKKNKILEVKDKVILKDFLNDFIVYSEKIIYNLNKEIIKSFEETRINYKNDFVIITKDISLNKKENIFFTEKKTSITDKFKNEFILSSFEFDLNQNTFKAEKINLIDNENNSLMLKNGYVDLRSSELIGSDFNLKMNKGIFGNNENDPRLVGRYIIANKSETSMKKSKFTTCKEKPGKCPSWSISADEVSHKKKKKRIEYKNAWLQIYDIPVAYFPYFFHPDPTVERQSGFLFPEFINSSNLGFSSQIPYFKAIDNERDVTISPRLYSNNNLFIQTEYRQAFRNSDFITDISYNKKENSNSHIFASFFKEIEDSFIEMKLETVSNNNYLKKYQIKSPLIDNYTTLNSSFSFEKYNENYAFATSFSVIEDLTKPNNDKYEYIFPNYDFSKDIYFENNFFDSLNLKSSGNYRKYNTNVDEADIVNDLIFNLNNQNQLNNLDTELKLLVRNINTYGDLSSTHNDQDDYKVLGSVLLNFQYPLLKQTSDDKKFLTPLISLRYSPFKGRNLNNEKTLLTFDDLFELDRIDNRTIENNFSTTIGMEYKKLDNLSNENLKIGLGVNLRNKIDNDLPESSSIGQKTSDIIGYSGINITDNLSFNYDFSIDQNLSGTNYTLASLNYSTNKFKTSFEYLEKSNLIGDESYLNNKTQLQINKLNSIAFETNKNIDRNLTNYYNLIYEYKNDCLTASIIYNKQFYQDDAVNSGKNIFFKISFLPFGNINTPNINE